MLNKGKIYVLGYSTYTPMYHIITSNILLHCLVAFFKINPLVLKLSYNYNLMQFNLTFYIVSQSEHNFRLPFTALSTAALQCLVLGQFNFFDCTCWLLTYVESARESYVNVSIYIYIVLLSCSPVYSYFARLVW